MYGFVGDFKLKLANDHNDDDDDAADTREAVVQGQNILSLLDGESRSKMGKGTQGKSVSQLSNSTQLLELKQVIHSVIYAICCRPIII